MVADHSDAARPRTSLIVRPRLIERLARRFEARLTLLSGGGGSGKTTILAQAIDAKTDGIDVWYPCTSADRDPNRLLAGLCHAVEEVLDAEPVGGPGDPASAIASHLLNASPRAVCLVIDDAHLLTTGDAIETLLELLPTNAHLLLSGRTLPRLSTARLDAAGQLVEIEQDELLMTEDEQIEFANARAIDVARLAGADGWPAFVELASAGTQARSRRYLQEEAVTALSTARRKRLASFAFVGGGDDEIARAVGGIGLAELVDGLPLVRWSRETAQLHDLWGELLVDELDRDGRHRAALAASSVHRSHRRIDAAIDLGVAVGDGQDIVATISAAIRNGVDGGIHRDRLEQWSALLQVFAENSPIAALVDGLIERELDSTSTAVWDLLDDAATRLGDAAEHELQLVALAQLGYVARCLYSAEHIDQVMGRIEKLANDYPPAQPFLAFGEAWKALTVARSDLQLAAMESIADAELPAMWRITRDHLHAHALFSMGLASEAIEWVPKNMADLPVPIPGSLTTEAQCYWYAGQPDVAYGISAPASEERHGLRDQYMTTAWTSVVAAYAGEVSRARGLAGQLSGLAGERLGAVDAIFGPALAAVVDVAAGDEQAAAAKVRQILELAPLGNGPSEQAMRGNVAVPYVLLPETRDFWRSFAVDGTMRIAIELATGFVESREDGSDRGLATLDWPEPGVVASALPVRWAIEFALRGVRAGRREGRILTAWLCEHWGVPARELLREFAADPDFGDIAADVIATTPLPPVNTVGVRVLGRTDLLIDGQGSAEPNWRRERVRALLVWLVLNPNTTRQQVAGALWPDLGIDRAAKNLRTTLNYVHGLLEPRRASRDATWFVRIAGQHIKLHHDLNVDLWRYREALDEADRAEREGRANDALEALTQAVRLWRGDLAEDLDHEWLELERIHLRSRFVRASCRAAELLTATSRPNEAIELLRPALAADPWHERSYLALGAAYEAVGDRTSARAIADRAASLLGA